MVAGPRCMADLLTSDAGCTFSGRKSGRPPLWLPQGPAAPEHQLTGHRETGGQDQETYWLWGPNGGKG